MLANKAILMQQYHSRQPRRGVDQSYKSTCRKPVPRPVYGTAAARSAGVIFACARGRCK